MSRKSLICAVSVGLLAVGVWEVYACSPPPPPPAEPIARINGSAGSVTIYACEGSTVVFDGSASSDPDGGSITNYKWEFPAGADEVAAHGCSCDGCGTKCLEGPTCKKVECIFTWTGDHVVKLTVTDNDNPADTNTCQATVKVVGVNDVNAGVKMTGQTLFLANDYLDEPANRPNVTQNVRADLYPAGVGIPDCFVWSVTEGATISPDNVNDADFTAKDHSGYTITATAGTSSKSMEIAIEGIDVNTANITDADEMTETYNIFLNENFDAWYYEDTNTLPGHVLCMDVDYNYPYLYYYYGYSEIGAINLTTVGLDYSADVNFVTTTPAIIRLHKSAYQPLAFNTWYGAGTLPDILSVDGIAEGTTTLKAIIRTQDGFTAEDELKIKVIRLNLKAVDPAPSSDQHEICHRDKLIIPVNRNDSDDDGVVDWSDSSIPGGDPDLAKVTLEKPAGVVASDISGDITVKFPSELRAFKTEDKTGGVAPTSYSFSALPVDIYLEGNTPSSVVLDANVWAEMTLNSGVKCHDEIWYTVIEVELLVNNTESEDDDYVVKEKPAGARDTAWVNPGEVAGPNDNHIPMKIRLQGPTGFSCKVKLSDAGVGDVTIKKTDGSPYPAEGETVTVGTDLEVHIFGTTASSGINDVKIRAKTDKTGNRVCGEEDLTVIWVEGSNMSFRGSAQQGQALTSCSTAEFTDFFSWMYDKVGTFIYHEPIGPNSDAATNHMELKVQISPNVVISDVTWDIRREASGATWGPGTDPRSRTSIRGATNWAPDDSGNGDEDLIQNSGCKEIFSIDSPGTIGLPYTANYGFTFKGKFQEWVQVKIGDKWYVCSPYKEWRSIIHIKYKDATDGWVYDIPKINEIVLGPINGFAGSWSE